MSIKCSLLGHSFDETSVERDRQEDGSEVVITITELETCSRCDETRVVSENKEVTTLETPDDDPDIAGETDAGAGSATGDGTDDAPADYDPDGDDAEILDADSAEADAQADARGTASIPDAESDDATADDPPEEDDAVILDGDSGGSATADDGPGSDHGGPGGASDQSPPADDTGVSESGADDGSAVPEGDAGQWPDDEAADATDAGGVSEPAVDGETGGDWPEEPGDSDPQQEPMDEWPEATRRDDRGDADGAGPDLEESASPTVTVPEGMFKCSQCGFETAVDSSSLRAGDFCPECHQGTLMQREDEEVDA